MKKKTFTNSINNKNNKLYFLDHDESNEDLVQCEGCSFEIDQCQCNSIIEIFHDINW